MNGLKIVYLSPTFDEQNYVIAINKNGEIIVKLAWLSPTWVWIKIKTIENIWCNLVA